MKFDESKHPRDSDGKFSNGNTSHDKLSEAVKKYSDEPTKDMQEEELPRKKKMTPDEEMPSVHIDFDRDNVLPELNNNTLEALGAKESKKVLLKKSIIDRNFKEHDDLTKDDFEQIIRQALYDSPEVFPANRENPDYYHLASIVETTSKGKPEIGLVLLDIDARKENFEIVHAHYVRRRSYKRLKNKQ